MHISVGAVSHHILFLEAIQAAVVGSEFQVITSPSKGLLAPNVAPALALSRFRSANPFDKLSPVELTVCDLVIEGSGRLRLHSSWRYQRKRSIPIDTGYSKNLESILMLS